MACCPYGVKITKDITDLYEKKKHRKFESSDMKQSREICLSILPDFILAVEVELF
jgi:hypothetical protein